jgi:Na+/proline symporter
MVGQDLVQRSLSSKNTSVAVSSSIMSGFIYALIGVIPIIIGIAARSIFVEYGITAEVLGNNLENQVLPRIAIMVFGESQPVILTIFIAALTAAIMSSADSSLLAGASLLCNNIMAPLFPNIRERKLLIATRLATVILTVVALTLAICVKSIYSLMINSWISQLVIIFLPVIMALHMPRATKSMVWSTMIVGTAVWLGYTYYASCGYGMKIVDLLGSEVFERANTCGAVYGFVSALLTMICCYIGIRISGDEEENETDTAK